VSRAALATVVAVSGTGLVLAGCGSSAKTTSPATRRAPGNARRLSVVTRAATKTAQVNGARVTMVGKISTPKGPLLLEGNGVFALDEKQGRLNVSFSGAESLTMTELFDDLVIYMSAPELSSATNGKTWLKIDVRKYVKALGGNLSQLTSGNPSDVLQRLRASGTVTEAGTESIRGVPTTHYVATIDVDKVAKLSGLGKLFAKTKVEYAPEDVWIDRQGYMRQIKTSYSAESQGQRVTVVLTMDLFDLGTPVHVVLPAPSDVYDGSSDLAAGTNKALGG
jgi:hypothetical protein